MIKNQLYPYIEKYINEYLYCFTKEQLEIGVLEGQIKLANLNLRPDKINSIMDEQNQPFWLKASLISSIDIQASLMNIIGERPLEIEINGVDIIVTPSYKWIIKNLNNYLVESEEEYQNPYNKHDNNSMNIFKKKVSVFDTSIFNKPKSLGIYKDKSNIAETLNGIFKGLFKFYYMLNFAVNVKIRNVHIRFEDDQLINYSGDIAMGLRIGLLEINLASDGLAKKDSFKISDFNVYVENGAKILISSDLLNNSLENGKLKEDYYVNLKKINFAKFTYKPDTKFIIQSFNCYGNFGTKSTSKGKLDIFAKQQNSCKVYLQFASGDININVFPELLIIQNNFTQFLNEFKIIEQVCDFKPFRKPYDTNCVNFRAFKSKIDSARNQGLLKQFDYKRKMLVRDWLYYFYWCHKSKSSLMGPAMNPLTLEFSRFFSLCFNNATPKGDEVTKNETPEAAAKQETLAQLNPDNVKISLSVEILFKGINVNLHPTISPQVTGSLYEFAIFKITAPEIRLNLDSSKFDVNFSIRHISFAPSKQLTAEKVMLGSQYNKKKALINQSQATGTKNFVAIKEEPLLSELGDLIENGEDDVEANTGLNGLLKKYKPNINKKIEKISNALENARDTSLIRSRLMNNPMTVHKSYNNLMGAKKTTFYTNNANKSNNKKAIPVASKIMTPDGVYTQSPFKTQTKIQSMDGTPGNNDYISVNNMDISGISKISNATKCGRYNSFAKRIINKCEGNFNTQKSELNRQKNDFNLSKTISDFNNKKNNRVLNDFGMPIPVQSQASQYNSNRLKASNLSINLNKSQIIMTGQYEQLNLLDIYGDETLRKPAVSIKYQKANYDIFNHPMGKEIITDAINVQIGTIRLNLLAEYVASVLNVMKNYQMKINKPQYKNLRQVAGGLKLYKQLLNMKEYILNHIEKMPGHLITYQMREYMEYLRSDIMAAKLLESQAEGYEINYFFSLLPKGIEIFVDYENFECVYYDGDKRISGKAQVPPLGLLLKLSNEKICLRFFDCVFELENIRSMKKIMQHIMKIAEEKLKSIQAIFIEPCLVELKAEMGRGEDKGFRKHNARYDKNTENEKNSNDIINTKMIGNNQLNVGNVGKGGIKKAMNDEAVNQFIMQNNYGNNNNIISSTSNPMKINKSNNQKVYYHQENTVSQEPKYIPDKANLAQFSYPNSSYYANNNK